VLLGEFFGGNRCRRHLLTVHRTLWYGKSYPRVLSSRSGEDLFLSNSNTKNVA
jgi:hypothetical protein